MYAAIEDTVYMDPMGSAHAHANRYKTLHQRSVEFKTVILLDF